MLIHNLTEFYARSYPDNTCLSLGEKLLTYSELDAEVNQLANAMLSLEFSPGQRIAILGENSIEHAICFLAASKIGAVAVPLNYRLAPVELAYVINDAEAKLLVVMDSALEKLASLREHLSPKLNIVSSSSRDSLHWQEWLEQFDQSAPHIELDRDTPLLQLYTSGTTGNPKGVVLSQYNLMSTIMLGSMTAACRPNVGSAGIGIAPLFHIGGAGYLLSGLANGMHIIIHETFDPMKFLDDIEQNPVEVVFMVPAMIMFVMQIPGIEKRDFSGIKQITYGASPISESLLREAIALFKCDFAQLYGMTETTGYGTVLVQNDHAKALAGQPELLRSCGRPNIGASVKLMDSHGNEVEQGEIGEIWLKSNSSMLHYYNLEAATASSLTDGWVHTGDAGYQDEEGYIYLKDRIKDMVVSGGENIYPTEVENALVQHPSIADVAVIGVPDEKFGEALLAVVVLAPEQSLTVEEMIAFCRDKIAGYKIPRQLKLIDQLPRNPSGKLLKKELRAPYWDGTDRGIG